MTRTNWDGTPVDIAEIPVTTGGVLEVGENAGTVTVQHAGPRGGLAPLHRLAPDAAREMAAALSRYADTAEEATA